MVEGKGDGGDDGRHSPGPEGVVQVTQGFRGLHVPAGKVCTGEVVAVVEEVNFTPGFSSCLRILLIQIKSFFIAIIYIYQFLYSSTLTFIYLGMTLYPQ